MRPVWSPPLSCACATEGIAILYISHYLNEIATLCDRGTVLRNGEVVGYPDRDLLQNTEALIAMMVGREIDQLYTPRQRRRQTMGRPAALGAPAERRAAAAGSFF